MCSKSEHANEGIGGAEQYYRHLFYSAGGIVIGTDCVGKVVDCSRAAELFFGLGRSKMVGLHITEIIHDANAKQFKSALDRAVNEHETTELEVDQQDNDSRTTSIDVTIEPVLDDKGKCLGLGVWVLDVTKRRELQRQLLHAEKTASLGTLAAGVAHHFNNIIGGVATFVDFALDSDRAETRERALRMTAQAADRIGKITDSLLTFAEQDRRQFDLSDLSEVVMTFAHLVEKLLVEKDIKFKLDLRAAPVYEVPGSRMHQVLGNLLDNAECAMPQGGMIDIALYVEGSHIILTFEDNGCGIASEELSHIFDPFFTTKSTGGNESDSAGLGLSVVHGVVQELGGSIRADSELGKGTKITIQFPVNDQSKH